MCLDYRVFVCIFEFVLASSGNQIFINFSGNVARSIVKSPPFCTSSLGFRLRHARSQMQRKENAQYSSSTVRSVFFSAYYLLVCVYISVCILYITFNFFDLHCSVDKNFSFAAGPCATNLIHSQ